MTVYHQPAIVSAGLWEGVPAVAVPGQMIRTQGVGLDQDGATGVELAELFPGIGVQRTGRIVEDWPMVMWWIGWVVLGFLWILGGIRTGEEEEEAHAAIVVPSG